jgi:hypothetical protein
MTWSFPRQINLPPIRSPREAPPPAPSLTAARPRSPIVGAFSSVRDDLLLLTSSPGQAYSQPPMGSGPRGLARQLGDRRTEPKGIGTKCETAQEQAPRRRDLQSLCCFFGSFSKDPIRH